MSKKAILVTFLSTIVLVVGVGMLSYFIWMNQPSADIVPPTPPEPPSNAPATQPPVPPVPRLKGDILDDGIVNALDINSVIVHWKQVAKAYNLVDDSSETTGTISGLDLSMVIKYWKCDESQDRTACPYLSGTADNDASATATATASSSVILPPVPDAPTE